MKTKARKKARSSKKKGDLKQAEWSSEEETSQQTGTHPEHESHTRKEVVDEKQAGVLTQTEEQRSMWNIVDKGCTNVNTTQIEITP